MTTQYLLTPNNLSRRRSAAARFGQCLLAGLVAACGVAPTPAPTQPPAEYLARALDWLQANSVQSDQVDWAALRREALARAPQLSTAADAYPALNYATSQLGDELTFFADPRWATNSATFGLTAIYPENLVVDLSPGGSAERAGMRLGDILETVDGAPPRQWRLAPLVDLDPDVANSNKRISVRRAGAAQPLSFTLGVDQNFSERDPNGRRFSAAAGRVGYIELPWTTGSRAAYATLAQHVLRDVDQPAACGWIVDLRRTRGGDIWTYLAALGPVLGEGEVGGFVYLDGQREPWAYRGSQVYWNNNQRPESMVEGPLYQPRRPQAPVAVLASHATVGAGELAIIAFHGRPGTRVFGEPTAGSPFLQFHTTLSDGAFLSASGAYGVDRAGRAYRGPIAPDEAVATDWTVLGSAQDPVIGAALGWLGRQPACQQS